MTLESRSPAGRLKEGGRGGHCWLTGDPALVPALNLHSEQLTSLSCNWTVLGAFLQVFDRLGSKIWLSGVKEKDEDPCLSDSDIKHSPAYSAWIALYTDFIHPCHL